MERTDLGLRRDISQEIEVKVMVEVNIWVLERLRLGQMKIKVLKLIVRQVMGLETLLIGIRMSKSSRMKTNRCLGFID